MLCYAPSMTDSSLVTPGAAVQTAILKKRTKAVDHREERRHTLLWFSLGIRVEPFNNVELQGIWSSQCTNSSRFTDACRSCQHKNALRSLAFMHFLIPSHPRTRYLASVGVPSSASVSHTRTSATLRLCTASVASVSDGCVCVSCSDERLSVGRVCFICIDVGTLSPRPL